MLLSFKNLFLEDLGLGVSRHLPRTDEYMALVKSLSSGEEGRHVLSGERGILNFL